jgi:hypothetical protein
MRCLLCLFALAACGLLGQRHTATVSVDFRNFTFPFPADEELEMAVPGDVTWMDLKPRRTVTLVNGRWDFDKDDPSSGPSVTLSQVHYGYLTMSGHLDAVVVLTYHTGGTAHWSYVYAYGLGTGTPKLLGWLQTGARAASGFRALFVSNGEFTLDVNDPEEWLADCCSAGFIRTTFQWKRGQFVPLGPAMFGRVDRDLKPHRGRTER